MINNMGNLHITPDKSSISLPLQTSVLISCLDYPTEILHLFSSTQYTLDHSQTEIEPISLSIESIVR